ncbi:hypothetical protein EMIHUDRAFT_443296 [Emiliania huxleyi CCMP1516]|uniref:TNase-like domain-containing protein n=2 Tax=Emiliania huxleyi TaxID=2903 RepID=A0A0D3JU03_EMIH1|nr:hypothetical protein EMIHUDRAFT_443296 [Emiliania huxleyi CCMP1516]EOD26988.1 hypothetical protein EMIHUDRAFT_443296 [Emiliania huxleyi CCMP1516]|eukprot:XP_005779417.1 hypothetical protein EMIHUDRAFT_443296 [Emiliania huxleyi CCMP1516]
MLPPLLLLTASAATGSTPSLRRLISRRPLLSAGAAAALGWSINAGRPRVYATVADIPDDEFRRHATLRCRVVKVSDGDTLRCEHEPLWSALIPSAGGPKKGKLSARSLSVRLYAIDAPETAKAGRPGQPLGGAATAFVSAAVLGKLVQVKLLSRDQYGRAVGVVSVGALRRRDLSEALLSQGLAFVYRGGGAQYDGDRARWDRLEAAARRQRRGVWATGGAVETPAEYKRRGRARV